MKFYSEYGEDQWLHERGLLVGVERVYVDIGCAHPEQGSNTALVRDFGWTGVALDANPKYQPHWDAVRSRLPAWPIFEAVILASEPEVPFKFEDNAAMSRICDGGERRKTVPINKLLADYSIGRIGLLSIDIEGAEYDVLKTLDLAKHDPQIIIAEYATLQLNGTVKEDFRVRDLLLAGGRYRLVHQTVANLIYLRD